MAVQTLCQACGKPNPEQARFCEDCGQLLQIGEDSREARLVAKPPSYVSTYHVARATAQFLSAVGWIVFAISVLLFARSLLENMSAAARGDRTDIAGLFWISLPFLGSAIGSLLLVGYGQVSRALVDTADFTGEMLAIMRAVWTAGKQQ